MPRTERDLPRGKLGITDRRGPIYLAEVHDASDMGGHTEESALELYTSNDVYGDLNYALRMDTKKLPRFGQLITALRRAVAGRSAGGTVWKGQNLSKEEADLYQVGNEFLWPGFTSSSRNPDVAYAFGSYGLDVPVIFEINLDGDGTTWSRDIWMFSEYQEEIEVLIYCYSGFRVIERQETDNAVHIKLVTVDTRLVEENNAKKSFLRRHHHPQPAGRAREQMRLRKPLARGHGDRDGSSAPENPRAKKPRTGSNARASTGTSAAAASSNPTATNQAGCSPFSWRFWTETIQRPQADDGQGTRLFIWMFIIFVALLIIVVALKSTNGVVKKEGPADRVSAALCRWAGYGCAKRVWR